MRALTWHGKHNVQVDTVPDPQIINPRDAIIKITATAICGSDLHLYDSMIPSMHSGDILGHEFMGEVVEVGRGNDQLKVGQRVVVPFVIACGQCFFCGKQQYSACDNSNPADTSDPSVQRQAMRSPGWSSTVFETSSNSLPPGPATSQLERPPSSNSTAFPFSMKCGRFR